MEFLYRGMTFVYVLSHLFFYLLNFMKMIP